MEAKSNSIKSFIVSISLFAFVFTIASYSIHQLEHINYWVCITTDVHLHKTDHQDVCKDLIFTPLFSFSNYLVLYSITYTNFIYSNLIIFLPGYKYLDSPPRAPPVV